MSINLLRRRLLMSAKGSHDYSKDYLTFTALESGTFSLTIPSGIGTNNLTSISYSTDGGTTWADTDNSGLVVVITTPTIAKGDKVLWKGVGSAISTGTSIYSQFSSTGTFNVEGNIMSLLYADFAEVTESKFFPLLFKSSLIVSAKNLVLPSTSVPNSGYHTMFNECVNLVSAPTTLPATTLSTSAYMQMFKGCTSLTETPILPADTMKEGCYYEMFMGCTSLTAAPFLLAQSLARNCFYAMFLGCTSLTSATSLAATSLAVGCYASMFYGCTSLASAPILPAQTLTKNCYKSMFQGCTSLTTAPSLPATSLDESCYESMFQGCTALTTAPVLPALTLVKNCYSSMLRGCSQLTYIKMMATDISASGCLANWVYLVSSSGTFVKNAAAEWTATGQSGIPNNWTVETASE